MWQPRTDANTTHAHHDSEKLIDALDQPMQAMKETIQEKYNHAEGKLEDPADPLDASNRLSNLGDLGEKRKREQKGRVITSKQLNNKQLVCTHWAWQNNHAIYTHAVLDRFDGVDDRGH